jgi:hypothetical protein
VRGEPRASSTTAAGDNVALNGDLLGLPTCSSGSCCGVPRDEPKLRLSPF